MAMKYTISRSSTLSFGPKTAGTSIEMKTKTTQ